MFNEHWPSMSWGVVDYLRHPKPGYTALKRAYQPVLPVATVRPKQAGLGVYVINDDPRALEASLTITYDNGSARWSSVTKLLVAANAVTPLSSWFRKPTAEESVSLALVDDAGRPLGSNQYRTGWFQRCAE
jgi:beta-mannosidase